MTRQGHGGAAAQHSCSEAPAGLTTQGQGWVGGVGRTPASLARATETSECPQGPDSSSPFIPVVTHSKVSSFEEKEEGKETSYPLPLGMVHAHLVAKDGQFECRVSIL